MALLLFEDIMVVPLLAAVAFLSPVTHGQSGWTDRTVSIKIVLEEEQRTGITIHMGAATVQLSER